MRFRGENTILCLRSLSTEKHKEELRQRNYRKITTVAATGFVKKKNALFNQSQRIALI